MNFSQLVRIWDARWRRQEACRDRMYRVRLQDNHTSGAFSQGGCHPEADAIHAVPARISRASKHSPSRSCYTTKENSRVPF